MGSGGTSVDYQMSPQQAQMLQAIMPLVQGLASYGMNNMQFGGGGLGGSNTPYANTYNDYLSSIYDTNAKYQQDRQFRAQQQDPENIFNRRKAINRMPIGGEQDAGANPYSGGLGGGNNIGAYTPLPPIGGPTLPGPVTDLFQAPNAPMPTKGWYDSISPEIMAGLWEPYNDSAKQMAEMLNMQGSLGAGGQYTGNALGNFGDFYSKAGTQIGTQAWNLMSPGMNQNYNVELQKLMMPFGLMGMTPSLMPTGIVQNESNTGGNVMGGALGGAAAGTAVSPGYGTVIGGVLGALAGLMQG
jgi:hypothetical protein